MPPSMLSDRVAALPPSIIRGMSRMRKASSIDLSLGQPALNPRSDLVERAVDRMQRSTSGYTETAGLMELRELVARHYRLPGRSEAAAVLVTCGSEQAVFASLLCSVNAGDEVLVPEPGYPAYPGIVRLVGGTPIAYPIKRAHGLVPSVADLQRLCSARTRAVVINTPSNPFGTTTSQEEAQRLADFADDNDLTLITDEIYRDLHYGDDPLPSVAQQTERAIFVGGLSKSCAMTGFRLGYLIAPPPFVTQASLAHQLMVTCAPRLSQLVALEVFKEPAVLTAHVDYYRQARAALSSAAQGLPESAQLFLGEGAFYGIVDVSALAAGDPYGLAVQLLEEEDVVVVPGNAFGASGDWFWRLSYAAGAEAAAEGMTRVARFLTKRAAR